MYTELMEFLRTEEVFIEVEGRPEKISEFIASYNYSYNEHLSEDAEGVIVLQESANKWGLELRLYVRNKPPEALDSFDFKRNNAYRDQYAYRLNDNSVIQILFEQGYRIGCN